MRAVAALALSFFVSMTAAPAGAKDGAAPADIAWTRAPSFAEVAAAYPSAAKAKGQKGEVTLTCRLDGTGRLERCETRSESPRGAGFAQAALGLTSHFQGPTESPNGQAGARVQIAFKFTLDPLEAMVVARPEWVVLPTPAQFQAVFPEAASKAGVLKAKAVMTCTVTAIGGLADCQSVSEEPAGYGFGQATLPLASFFRLKVWTTDGEPVVGGVVRLPLRYDMKQAPPAAGSKP